MKRFFPLLDLLRHYICFLKSPFLASFPQNCSSVFTNTLPRFCEKFAQKSSIFLSKANYAIGLLHLTTLMATEELPWIEPVLLPVLSLEAGDQTFNQYRSGPCYVHYRGRAFYLNGELFFAISPDLSFQLETCFTKTNHHGWIIDQVKQTGRYALLDDSRGDPLALTLGLELIQPLPVAIKDINFIHHAPFEVEWHLALGKEWAQDGERWASIYGLFALGFGMKEAPWIRGVFAADYWMTCQHVLGAKLSFDGGFGRKRLCHHHFKGYGNVAYRILDATFKYTYKWECGDITFKYLRSLLRINTPYAVQQFIVRLDFPFLL